MLLESDFGSHDMELCESLERAYPPAMVDGCEVRAVRDFRFVVPRGQLVRFTTEQWTALDEIAASGAECGRRNSVYAQVDEEDDLLVD